MLRSNKKKKGFTLIELIIVIAIIAILAAIAIPKFGDIRKNAALKSDVANAKVIANAASALIAEGEIKVPIIATGMILNINSGTNEGDSTQIANKAKTDISNYLQNVPTPESSGYDNYKVTIDTSGNVEVYITGTSAEKELYPDVPKN